MHGHLNVIVAYFLLVHTMVTFHINGALKFKRSVPAVKVKCTKLVSTCSDFTTRFLCDMGFTYIKNLFFIFKVKL